MHGVALWGLPRPVHGERLTQGVRGCASSAAHCGQDFSLTVLACIPILAHDEAEGLLVLVYVRHDGAAAQALKPRNSVMPQAVPQGPLFCLSLKEPLP